jgi:hypothetical protein
MPDFLLAQPRRKIMNEDTTQRSDPMQDGLLGGTEPAANTSIQSQNPSSGMDDVKRVATEKAHDIADDIKHGASEALDSAKEAGTGYIQEQKRKLSDLLDEYTHAMKAASESLEGEDHNPLVGPANRASRQLERTSEYLRNCEPMEMLHDLGDFAKRRPELVFGGMFLAGMAAVRFLKASSRNRGHSGNGHNGRSQLPRQYDVPRYDVPLHEPVTPSFPTPGRSPTPVNPVTSPSANPTPGASSDQGISPTFNPPFNPPAQQ